MEAAIWAENGVFYTVTPGRVDLERERIRELGRIGNNLNPAGPVGEHPQGVRWMPSSSSPGWTRSPGR